MTNPNDGAPLTRRQLRELAAQASGQNAAPAGQVAPVSPVAAAAAQPATHQQAPARVATQPGIAPAQQPMRTRTAPHGYPQADGLPTRRPGAGEHISAPVQPAQPAQGARPATALPQRAVSPAGPPVSRVGRPEGTQAGSGQAPVQAPGLAPQSPVPSRRSLREQTSSHRVVIVPPTQTSGIRTIDETGALSAIRDLGSSRPPMSARPAPAQPVAIKPATPQPGLRPALAEPQRPSLQRPPAQQSAPGHTWPAPAAHPPVIRDQIGQTFAPQGPGGLRVTNALSANAADAAQAAPLLREQAAREQAARDQAVRDQAVREQAARLGGAPPAWKPAPASDTVWPAQEPVRAATTTEGDAPMFRQRVTAPGFEPVPALQGSSAGLVGTLPAWDSITTPPPAAERLEADGDEDEDDDLDDDEPDHKYTWLHYLILVAVAFVLGLIIWKVGLENRGVASPADSAASYGIVIDAPRTPQDFYL
ncbi:hypothetical protein SAMN05216410_3673 [Sanguibacter gelidistatuariae]|uniref:Meckel syndrome type 1 protein n=1 Tax=Sanguibacter gelidistatuariae TaxID=1814289 RepID=A0A1G6WNC2_9MICO|nr:hypothetical protein [Sanguibacter gelidistatuariae]SDD66616.1 hypothetical protein SAMN05216410_3673 [Sanguibacter gelidistatuariae]